MLLSSIPQNIVGAEDKEKQSTEKSIENIHVNPSATNMNELENKRTEYTKTYEDQTGRLYKEIYAEPVHAKDGKIYEEIDNSVVTDQNNQNMIKTENTSLTAEFPKSLQNNKGIVFKRGEHQVEFELTAANQMDKKILPNVLSKAILAENKVQYNEIYPAVDLRHITFNEEVKEDWIIKKYTGINQFFYKLKTDLSPIIQADGSIGFFEKSDKVSPVFTLPAPEMMDSNINESKGEGTYSNQVKYLLNKNTDNSFTLTLDINKEWLASSDRKYPVYVDPSVSIDALGDAYISSKAPTTNFNQKWDPVQGEYVLQTGYYDSTSGTNYAFIKFSVANELKGAVIDSASLQAYVTHAYYATQKNGLWVDEANSKWAINEINWNNKPSSTKISSTLVGRDEWAKLDVKSTLQAWVSEERTNTGFKLHTNGNGKTYWKKITASESANKPKLVISYHYDQMPTPTMSSQLDNATAKTGSVNVNWKSVFGASSYKLQMFDGYRYETVYTGSALSWTSKDKKIFPKAPFSSSSRYKMDGTGTELPVDPSAFYSANLGSSTTTKTYKFRIVPVYPTGDGPTSTIISKEIPVPAGEPDLPTVTTGTYSETDTVNKGRGWLNVKWNKVANATGYKVRIWNGSVYKNYTVGKDTSSISTKGKKIWPTDTQIQSGVKDLYDATLDDASSVGKGAELPIDPSTTYGNSSSRYSVRVIAISAAGDSPSSDVNYGYMKLYAPKNVKITSNEDNLVQNKTSLKVDWSPSAGANYYEVQLNNGTTIEKYKVEGANTFTTPKSTYELGKQYSATVVAFFEDDDTAYESEEDKVSGQRGLSDKSNSGLITPSTRKDLLGLENYFTYDEKSIGRASLNVNVTAENLNLQFKDESLYTKGTLEFEFLRSYNSRSNGLSALGKGWTYTGNESISVLVDKSVEYEDEDGTVHTFKWNNNKFESPKGLYETLTYDNSIYVMKDKAGLTQTFKLNASDGKYYIYSYYDNFNNKIDFKRNEKGQLISISESEDKNNINIAYADDKISKVQYGEHWTKYFYSNNLLVKTVMGSDLTNRIVEEKFEYNTLGELTKYLDGKNNETSIKIDKNELVISDKQSTKDEVVTNRVYKFIPSKNEYIVTDSNENESLYKRDSKNNTFAVIYEKLPDEENQGENFYSYDNQYNIIEHKNDDGEIEVSTYDGSGNLLTSKNKDGLVTNEYNTNNQLTKTTSSNGEVTTNIYDTNKLISSSIGNDKTTYEYDSYGRPLKTLFSNGTVESFIYDDINRNVTSIDTNGNSSSYSYSIYGQKIKEVNTEGKTKRYTYDPIYLDTITSVIDALGNETKYKYDNNDNLTEVIDALGRQKTYSYDENDQVTEVNMPNTKFKYIYDQDGELLSTVFPSGLVNENVYNLDGQLSQEINGNEKIDYNYDENGNVSEVFKNDSLLKKYCYFVNGICSGETSSLLSLYTLGLFNQSYLYDQQSREVVRNTSFANDFNIKQDIEYSESSDEVNKITYSNSDKTANHSYVFENDLTNNQEKMILNEDLLNQTVVRNKLSLVESIDYTTKKQPKYSINYEYSKEGNTQSMIVNNKRTSYTYDANSQLISEQSSNGIESKYSYDAVGNRLEFSQGTKKTSYSYNDMNQIVQKNNFNYLYDADGNLIKDEKYTYKYDGQQNLVKVESNSGTLISEYTYDEEGLRTSKKTKDGLHRYFYNDDVLDMEVIEKGGKVSEYRMYEWNEFSPLGMIVKKVNEDNTTTNESYHFITNLRGDVLSIRDSNDSEVGSYEYDAFGNIIDIKGDVAIQNSIRYAGYYFDSETANYYLQSRYYNAENGSFLSLDPYPGDVIDPISQTGYNYSNNNPVTNIDPEGSRAQVVVFFFKGVKAASKFIWKKTKSTRNYIWKKAKKTGKYVWTKVKSSTAKIYKKAPKKPLGRGHSKGGRQPVNLKESLAMREAMYNASKGKTIVPKKKMTDKRWLGKNGWVKKAYNVSNIEIHYVYNTRTKAIDDFKIK